MSEGELARGLEEGLARAEDARVSAESVIETVHQGFVVFDDELDAVFANRHSYHLFQIDRAETQGQRVFALGHGLWNIDQSGGRANLTLTIDVITDRLPIRHASWRSFDAIAWRETDRQAIQTWQWDRVARPEGMTS